MTSAPSCSISRRVSLMTVSEVSSPQPTPTSLSGWSPIAPPVNPAFGLFGSFGVAPANCASAETAPAMFCWSNAPNAPLHSDMIAILIGVPEPPLRGATAGCGEGASAGADGPGVLLDELDELAPLLDESLPLSMLVPHAATTSASAATVGASQNVPRPEPRSAAMILSPPRRYGYVSTDGCGLGRPPLLRDVPGYRPPAARGGPL